MNTEAIKYLENIKILMLDEKNGVQTYQVRDKETNHTFVERVVLYEIDDKKTAEKCQKDYCEWFREKGKKILEKYYKK